MTESLFTANICVVTLWSFGMRGVLLPALVALLVNIGVLFGLPYVGRGMERVFFVRAPFHRPFSFVRLRRVRPRPAPRLQKSPPQKTLPQKERVQRLTTLRPQARSESPPKQPPLPLPSPLPFGLRLTELPPLATGLPVGQGAPAGVVGGTGGRRGRKGQTRGVVLLQSAPVSYPRWALEQGIEGCVVVRMLVDEKGRVVEAHVSRTSGYASLDEAALEAVRRYRFLPALKDGLPVKRWVEQEFVFRIER